MTGDDRPAPETETGGATIPQVDSVNWKAGSMTTTPPGPSHEPTQDPDIFPSGDPEPIHVDPENPDQPTAPDESERPD
ncbi:MAG: hypothetical protein QM747_17960 [Nocardioides sp.]